MSLDDLSVLQFCLLALFFVCGVMVLLQALINRSIWTPCIIGFSSRLSADDYQWRREQAEKLLALRKPREGE